MNLLKRLFSTKRKSPDNLKEAFKRIFIRHLERIKNTHQSTVNQYFTDEILAELSSLAEAKMELSLTDGEEHSAMISYNGAAYYINTLPIALSDGSTYYTQQYGGYSQMLDRILRSDQYMIPGNEILFHIAYFVANEMNWVTLSILPSNSNHDIQPILATDLLNISERRKFGL